MSESRRPVVWLHSEIKTPPFSSAARIAAGVMLRRLQSGERLGLPHVRPMPTIGARCAELRVVDNAVTWRILYRLDNDAVVIVAVFAKKTEKTPLAILAVARTRLRQYDQTAEQYD